MLIFIDTEFTDFKRPELISIGLVADDGEREFYAELPVNRVKCNDFVLANVLPLLGAIPGAYCPLSQLVIRLRQWLDQFKHQAPVSICYDFDGDWELFCRAMEFEIPEWLTGRNIYPYIDQVAWQRFFLENDLREHHALHDARGNRHAFDADKARTDAMQFRKSR